MRRRLRRWGLMTLLLGGMTLGCTRAAVQHKEPPDPLLVTKKPVEGRPRRADADLAPDAMQPPPPPVRESSPVNVLHGGAGSLGLEPAGNVGQLFNLPAEPAGCKPVPPSPPPTSR